jgi:hypothetical protein
MAGLSSIALILLVLVAPRVEAAWSTHAGNAQHTALAAVPTQPLQEIHWQTPVDLHPQEALKLIISGGSYVPPAIGAATAGSGPFSTRTRPLG